MYLNKKTVICILMCVWVVLMAVGYAIFQERLTITGTGHIDSNCQIEIVDVTESDIVGDAKDKVVPSYTGTTAKFKVSLINPTDSITYNIKIKNLGTLDARIKKLNIDIGESDAIIYDVNLVKNDGTNVTLASNNQINQTNINNTKNTKLSPNEEQTVKLKVTFKEGYIGQPSAENSSNTIKMTIDYVQNFEENGQQILPKDEKTYSIGDKITFAGSDWHVIEDSSINQDYVVLLKDNLLTNTELGEYAAKKGSAAISYYYDDNCHAANTYGYTDEVTTGCSGHNDYDGSKIKEFLEGNYLSQLDGSRLKEISGYKIRLIKQEEFTALNNSVGNASEWLYGISKGNYWTMTVI